jgi:anti-anti-sigma factor
MELIQSETCGIPLLEVRGEVDHLSGHALEDAVNETLGDGKRIVLDLANCEYMDSGGISVLLSLLLRVRPEGVLAVVAPDRNLLRTFEIVGMTLDKTFRVIGSREEVATLCD